MKDVEMKRDSFVFYKSFYDSIKELDTKYQVEIYNAIFSYQFDGKVIDLDGVAKSIFTLILPILEANNKRYINGCKGGKPKKKNDTKIKPNSNLTLTEVEPNVLCIMNNDNVNDNDIKEKNIIKKKVFKKPTIEEVEEYCRERNNGIDASRFVNFYESKNWMVGKNKMVDWKACVRTWEQRNKKEDKLPGWWDKDYKIEEDEYDELAKQFTRGIDKS